MSDVLARICADKRAEVARRQAARPRPAVEADASAAEPPRGFARALASAFAAGRPALIAEIKKASPSRGLIRADFDPPSLAAAYRDAGATCLSVLTDTPYFQGEDSHLRAARASVALPVLRKDFTVDPYQVVETRALGADCILLIMAALTRPEALALNRLARDLGLDVLAEIHALDELDQALALDGAMIGINNRDLKTLKVDIATFETVARQVPSDRLLVAESGLRTPADVARVSRAGARAILVGESLMSQADVAAATRALIGAAVPA
ncbi:MAG: indole-3-glycerol phosphate synthase TrpC [Alphaproteobacteria bacterium]|nr:indole-3-glycerol phosphate synthase TrpC [Alphaproteobacteria bacterium]